MIWGVSSKLIPTHMSCGWLGAAPMACREGAGQVARGRDLAARGQRVLPGRTAGLVRGAGGGVRAGNRAEPALETEPGPGAGASPAGMRADGAGGAGVQGLPLPDAGQLELFADRTSAQTMRANQLRLYFASFAYALLELLRRWGLPGTRLARAQCGTIRLKLLKIGVRIRVSVRAVRLSFDEGFPEAGLFGQVLARLQSLPLRC